MIVTESIVSVFTEVTQLVAQVYITGYVKLKLLQLLGKLLCKQLVLHQLLGGTSYINALLLYRVTTQPIDISSSMKYPFWKVGLLGNLGFMLCFTNDDRLLTTVQEPWCQRTNTQFTLLLHIFSSPSLACVLIFLKVFHLNICR